ncbi:MAG: cobalamin-binding protein [Gemmatimonadota bacterium]|nr:MAG: cobalamin-binding protein [Gemmatimonadota bacterium]
MRSGQVPKLALLLAFSACWGGPGREASIGADSGGRGSATRVISLIPSATETIVALGAADRLIARTDYDIAPALAHLPSVGQGLTPSLEQLAMLQPDLVIAWPDNTARSVIARLADLGIDTYSPSVQTLADLRSATREVGGRLGLERSADSLIAKIDAGLDDVREAAEGRDRPSVFYVVWYDPPTTAGSGTYINELIEIAGGRNLFADAPGAWPQVSLEEVVRRQPDIVIFSQTEESPVELEHISAAAGWHQLRAINAGSVAVVDANLFNRPGPKVADVARRLAELLHPDIRSDRPVP